MIEGLIAGFAAGLVTGGALIYSVAKNQLKKFSSGAPTELLDMLPPEIREQLVGSK